MYCSDCGKQNNDFAKFCFNCGLPINGHVDINTEQGVQSSVSSNAADLSVVKKSKAKFVFIAIAIVIVLIVFYSQNINSYKTVGNLIFCEDVTEKLEAVNEGDVFELGYVFLRLESADSFNTNNLEVMVLKINEGIESIYDTYTSQVNPKWDNMAHQYYFYESGEYRIEIYSDSKLLASNKLKIQ